MSVVFPRDSQVSAALFTDLYELTMAQAYAQTGMKGTAVFELFFRELPRSRNFAVAAGLDALLSRLEQFRFHESELNYLSDLGMFSDAFLDAYLAAEGPGLLACVGSYRLEGMGAQLFEAVEGDYFTVLGLPLWPVLAELRRTGVLAS